MSKLMYRYYPESRFGHFSNIDGTIAFYLRVQALTQPNSVVIDLGCGRGEGSNDTVDVRKQLRTFRGKVQRVIGLDVDKAGIDNPLLDEFRQIVDTKAWPAVTGEADLCICDYVLEHIEDPDAFLNEVDRILKPGGYFCARTANVWGYVGIISRLTPNRFHAKITGKAQEIREERDVFPTHYRCNTLPGLRSLFKRYRFDAHVYGVDGEPNYLTFSSFFYGLGVLYQRFAPAFFCNGIVVLARKPLDGETVTSRKQSTLL
jgi:SAM-dependent methyltransferase